MSDFSIPQEALDAFKALEDADRASGKDEISAVSTYNSDLLARHPYSVRLTGRELHSLRELAVAKGMRASELARQLIREGVDRLAAEYINPIAKTSGTDNADFIEIKKALKALQESVNGISQALPSSGTRSSITTSIDAALRPEIGEIAEVETNNKIRTFLPELPIGRGAGNQPRYQQKPVTV